MHILYGIHHAGESETTLILEEAQWDAKISEIEKIIAEINRRHHAQRGKGTGLPIFQKQLRDERQIKQIKRSLLQLLSNLKAAEATYQNMIVQVERLEALIDMDRAQEVELQRENEEKFEEEFEEELTREYEEKEEELELEELEVEEQGMHIMAEEAVMEEMHHAEEAVAAIEILEEQYKHLPKEELYKKLEENVHDLSKISCEPKEDEKSKNKSLGNE